MFFFTRRPFILPICINSFNPAFHGVETLKNVYATTVSEQNDTKTYVETLFCDL